MSLNTINPQSPSAVVMIRPHNFNPNPETAYDNGFQSKTHSSDVKRLSKLAYNEFNHVVKLLVNNGIKVHLFDDDSVNTPDSVFPNNWFSTHPEGTVALYPMYAPNRRKERRNDVLEMLKHEYNISQIVDYSASEQDNVYLEGTGAMVIDHINAVAFMIKSNRADQILFERFCKQFNYQPFIFNAVDLTGSPIYHTNVFMSIATYFAVVSLEMIPDPEQRQKLVNYFEQTERTVIDLSTEQVYQFAGNCIELTGTSGKVLALSRRAFNSLTNEQKALIEKTTKLLPLNVETIEMAGGSVRCMIAGIHLSPRKLHQH